MSTPGRIVGAGMPKSKVREREPMADEHRQMSGELGTAALKRRLLERGLRLTIDDTVGEIRLHDANDALLVSASANNPYDALLLVVAEALRKGVL